MFIHCQGGNSLGSIRFSASRRQSHIVDHWAVDIVAQGRSMIYHNTFAAMFRSSSARRSTWSNCTRNTPSISAAFKTQSSAQEPDAHLTPVKRRRGQFSLSNGIVPSILFHPSHGVCKREIFSPLVICTTLSVAIGAHPCLVDQSPRLRILLISISLLLQNTTTFVVLYSLGRWCSKQVIFLIQY